MSYERKKYAFLKEPTRSQNRHEDESSGSEEAKTHGKLDHAVLDTASESSQILQRLNKSYVEDRMCLSPEDRLNSCKYLEAIMGLVKLKRIFRDKTYRNHGYKYKTEFQLRVLSSVLSITRYPNAVTRDNLGILLNLNPRSVQIWFQNARQSYERTGRMRVKRESKEKCYVHLQVLIDIYMKHCRR